MDNDKILKNSNYIKSRKTTWFDKNSDKLEMIILSIFLIILSMFCLLIYKNTKTIENQNNLYQELLITNQESEQAKKEEQKPLNYNVEIVNSKKEVIFNKTVDINKSFVIENKLNDKYYLKDNKNLLFETKTNTNKITCTLGETIESLKCKVEETVVTPPVAPTTPDVEVSTE